MREHCTGFDPVVFADSRVLVLGSFPSVKSREEGFYYGNARNAFWRTVALFFGEDTPRTVEDKRAFLARRRIALWDVVTACSIEGSADSSIEAESIADIPSVTEGSAIAAILCNGATAYRLLAEHFPQYLTIAKRMPSTSPANPRFNAQAWFQALGEIFS